MICFLTSRTDRPETDFVLNPANRFIDELRAVFPSPCRALHICSDPNAWDRMDYFAAVTRKSFEDAGFVFQSYGVLDGRNETQAKSLVHDANLLILSGGHVPTQNRFFQKIRLHELLRDHEGLVVGVSAGSMNSASLVYAQPEEEGEAVDPAYQRFLPGLGLTKTMLLPHYQIVRDDVLDGLRLFADVTCPDSMGRCFYAIPDGSYLLVRDGIEELRGEAYRIRDGIITQISRESESVQL